MKQTAKSRIDTKTLILDVSLKLFAEHGLRGVALRDINKAADQKNPSAIHYHFESRDGLIDAILAKYVPELEARRNAYLETAQETVSARSAANAYVSPLGDLLNEGPQERWFLQFSADLMSDPLEGPPRIKRLIHDTGTNRALALLISRLPIVPKRLRDFRLRIGTMMVVHSLADRARYIEEKGGVIDRSANDEFVSNLLDMYLAAMVTPTRD